MKQDTAWKLTVIGYLLIGVFITVPAVLDDPSIISIALAPVFIIGWAGIASLVFPFNILVIGVGVIVFLFIQSCEE